MTARDQSSFPAACSSARSSSCNCCHTPASFHSSRRRQHFIPDPNPSSFGRNSHWIPVCSTNRIPDKTCRSGIRFRPGRRGSRGTGLGSNGSMRCHRPSGTIHGGCSPRRTAQDARSSSTKEPNHRPSLLGALRLPRSVNAVTRKRAWLRSRVWRQMCATFGATLPAPRAVMFVGASTTWILTARGADSRSPARSLCVQAIMKPLVARVRGSADERAPILRWLAGLDPGRPPGGVPPAQRAAAGSRSARGGCVQRDGYQVGMM